MRIPSTTRAGLALASATAAISGVAVFVNGLVVASFPDPVALAAVRNGLVGVVILAIAGLPAIAREARALELRRRLGLFVLGVIGGGVPFILFFSGLGAMGGPGAAVIHKSMFVWVAVLAVPLLGERIGRVQVAGLLLLAVGTLLAGPAPAVVAGPAAALVLAATWLWAVEVVLARRLLGSVSVKLAAASRMTVGSLVIFGWLALNGRVGAVAAFGLEQWAIMGVTGALLLGYVATWYGALQRASATSVSAVLVGGAVVTAALAALKSGAIPAAPVAVGLFTIAIGVAAVWLSARRAPASVPERA